MIGETVEVFDIINNYAYLSLAENFMWQPVDVAFVALLNWVGLALALC